MDRNQCQWSQTKCFRVFALAKTYGHKLLMVTTHLKVLKSTGIRVLAGGLTRAGPEARLMLFERTVVLPEERGGQSRGTVVRDSGERGKRRDEGAVPFVILEVRVRGSVCGHLEGR